MSTASTPKFDIAEPIPGYRTQERIGAGGYGEVWKAEAPGGIAKAIKVVFGYRDDERAARELAALNRIKEASHPFVISLERIEMIDGHLVIVTELASANLKQLFEQCRGRGLPGIPRGELLGYLRDAADALDYLCREHSLQHLDVKPENLLLVGGRIKVGDFGLVKDLQDVNCSMISGLTPVYAGPELFDGRPSLHSDQYSLAIVYQEMLTGMPPFEGRTTAQLAAQHLHSRPRLDRLPASDQATIGRALSKNPEERFACCRDMVDSLLEVTPNLRSPAPRPLPPRSGFPVVTPTAPSASAPMKTEVLTPESLSALSSTPATPAAPPRPTCTPIGPAPEARDLPPLNLKPEDLQYRPTVFVGIGGFAARTLQSLHSRLANDFGDLSSVPALQLLLFDTDSETLKAVTEGDTQTSLGDDAAVLLPLRQPADYRCESSQHLQWLSRRWIYNIPRSLQTQGLRPLGRLALVDHLQRVSDRITRVIQAAIDPDAIALSAERTGLPWASGAAPRVFLVSSISGGTGGGMVLDVAYLVRKVLRELGLADDALCGVLAHCTSRTPQGRDLSTANAYAFLAELRHCSDSQIAYPGDPSGGLPAFAAEESPFAQTYLVHLGEDLEPAEFTAAVGRLARYLYCSSVTPAVAFFDRCRQRPTAEEQPSADPTVRTFGLCPLGFSYDDVPMAAADELAKALILRWRGLPGDEPESRPSSLSDPGSLLVSQSAVGLSKEQMRAEVAQRASAMGLEVRPIIDQLYAAAMAELGHDTDAYLLTVLGQVVSNYQATRQSQAWPPGELILQSLDTLLRTQDMQDGPRVCVETVLEKHLTAAAAQYGAALRDWILGLVTSPNHRVEQAQRAADYVSDYLRTLGREAGESIQARREQLGTLKESILGELAPSHGWLQSRGFAWRRRQVADRRLTEYFRLSLEELTLNGVCRMVGLILAQVATLNDKLRNLAADLNRMAEEFQRLGVPSASSQATSDATSETAVRVAAEAMQGRKSELLAQMEQALEEDLRLVVNTEGLEVRALRPRVRRVARSTILQALKQVVLRDITVSGECEPGGPVFSLTAGLDLARPRLSQCGGTRRLLLIAPEEASSAALLEALAPQVPQPPTTVINAAGGVLLCYEAEQLSLRHAAAAVLDGRTACIEVASRLHTRIDVTWTPL
jgi:serine/threonine protein kinase